MNRQSHESGFILHLSYSTSGLNDPPGQWDKELRNCSSSAPAFDIRERREEGLDRRAPRDRAESTRFTDRGCMLFSQSAKPRLRDDPPAIAGSRPRGLAAARLNDINPVPLSFANDDPDNASTSPDGIDRRFPTLP
jgi:hypothetical protein